MATPPTAITALRLLANPQISSCPGADALIDLCLFIPDIADGVLTIFRGWEDGI